MGALKKNISNGLALVGLRPGLSSTKFNRLSGTACKFAVLTQSLKPIPSREERCASGLKALVLLSPYGATKSRALIQSTFRNWLEAE